MQREGRNIKKAQKTNHNYMGGVAIIKNGKTYRKFS